MSKTVDKIVSFANKKKSSILGKIENSSALVILGKWLFTNKATTLFVFLFTFTYGYYYIQNMRLRAQLLETQVEQLQEDQQKREQERLELLNKIDAYEKAIQQVEQENIANHQELSGLKDDELKKRFNSVYTRLKAERKYERKN